MITRSLCCLVVTLSLALIDGVVYANQQVTYVSANGSDTNSGTQAAPCATFAGAIANTSDGGEIYVLNPGVYINAGSPLTLHKSVTIDGGAGRMGHIKGKIVLGLGANKVTLRNLTFNCADDGIDNQNGSTNLVVDNCTFSCDQYAITTVTQNALVNITITNSTFTGGDRAVWIEPGTPGSQITLQNDTITGASGAGIFVEALGADVNNCLVTNCYEGVTVDDNGFASVENSNITHNNIGVIVNQDSALNISNDNLEFNHLALDPLGNGELVSAGNNKLVFNVIDGSAPGFSDVVE